MSAIKLKNGIYSVGVLNPALRVFDIVMEAKYGTSYNAFLITGEKNILIETVHADFFEEYIKNIEQVVSLDKIDALIMNHTEPDHSGSVAQLLKRCPNLTIYCTVAAKKYMEAIANESLPCHIIKPGETLDLGNSRELQFIPAPLLHWPDSMFTWYPAEKTLFTCDFLGTHYCEPTMLDTGIHDQKAYEEQFAYYFKGIFGPFKPYVLKGLVLADALPAEMICTSHGPCLTKSIEQRKELYRLWSTPKVPEKKLIFIPYVSAYGYTKKLAEAVADALSSNPNLEVSMMDLVHADPLEVASKINSCQALLVGSDTINRDAPSIVWKALAMIDAINTRKPAGAFGSFGWSGEAVPMIKARLEGLKFKFQGDGLRVNFMPTEEDLNSMKNYALQIVSSL